MASTEANENHDHEDEYDTNGGEHEGENDVDDEFHETTEHQNNSSSSAAAHRAGTKVFIRQLPQQVAWDEIEDLAKKYGDVDHTEHTGNDENPSLIVHYKSPDDANNAVNELNNHEFHGSPLRVSIFVDRQRQQGPRRGNRSDFARPHGDMPLRMAVDARYVGAIIGQAGGNIRQITRDSKARCVVDVNRGIRDASGNMEKVINIYGMPENCSKACAKILEVVMREQGKDPTYQGNPPEPELKMRAHNNLVGRLIGKGGSSIKKIMEDTGCTIFVSNISELNAFNQERTITIRGTFEAIGHAEEKISGKLRQCYESDMMNAPHNIYGAHPLMVPPAMGAAAAGMPPMPSLDPYNIAGAHMSMFPGAAPYPTRQQPMHQMPTETVYMFVPNNMVGALIGTKGVHIRNVMRMTGAMLRIDVQSKEHDNATAAESREGDEAQQQSPDPNRQEGERLVTITGTEPQQYKAQFWIYQKVSEACYHFFEEVRLCTEVKVPSKLVGRIIGKAGANVRELQRITGAQVKIPEDAAAQHHEETTVRIIGNFTASQAVQNRIRQLVHQHHQQMMRMGGGDASLGHAGLE